MELYKLRTFAAVAELGHLTRAAERLHISQPAVSGQIRSLEEEWGAELFLRTPGGMVLSKAGARLLPFAQKVLAAADELRAEVHAIQGRLQGVLKVGTVSDPGYLRLGEFLSKMVERYPMVNIQMHKETSGEALAQLSAGNLDASFFFGDALPAHTDGVRLTAMTYRIIAPLEWRKKIEAADWKAISRLPWVMMPENTAYHQLLVEAFEQRGLKLPQKLIEADQAAVITDLVATGVGVSLAREEVALAGRDAGRWIIWEPARLTTALWFVYPSRSAHEPVIEALLAVLNEVWSDASGASTATSSGVATTRS